MTRPHTTFGSVDSLMATTSSAQSSSPSTAATGTNASWSVGVEGGNRGGRRTKGEHGRLVRSDPAAKPGQSPPASGYQGTGVPWSAGTDRGCISSAWSRGPPAIQSPPASGYQATGVPWSAGTDEGYGYSAWSRGPPVAQSGQSQSPPASASASQDQAKGKGKGKKRKRKKKPSAAGQSQADDLHDKAQELKIEIGTEESNEEVCFICAEPVKYYSVSACNHRTCHVCALKLRALYKKPECTFCKEPQQSVVFTASPDKSYEQYYLGRMPHKDSKLSIFFETREMMEETLILLRFNCPDPNCDYIGNGYGDLKLHARAGHGRLMCDLCIRNKKVFAHEHTLYQPSHLPFHLPSMIQGHRQNAPKSQIEGGVHPMCEFCRECFFGDDELYAHHRERHEQCFICKRSDIRNQYFQDYSSLELHFQEAHHPCTQSQCFARKFVVFGTLLDLKAHMLEEHGGDMSSRDRKDARRIIADLAFDDRHGHERRVHYYERDQEPEREREPPPVPRQSQATGQSRRRESFGARLTFDGESSILASQPAIESNRMLSPTREDVDPTFADRNGTLISRLQLLAPNPTTAIPAVKVAMRGYRLSEYSARDLISTIWTILDRNVENTTSIVNAFVDLLEEEEKKQGLLASWKGFAIEQRRQFPELVPSTVGENWAAIATRRVPKAKHPTMAPSSPKSPRALGDRVAQATSPSIPTQPFATSVASSSQFSALETFPPLSPTLSSSSSNHLAILSPSQTTSWTSSGVSNVAGYGAAGLSMTPNSMAENVSWASLLKPSSPTAPGSCPQSGRNMLPTSNVVGISNSSSAMSFSASSTSAGVSSCYKAELVALLTNGPRSASAFSATGNNGGAGQMCKLRHKGLINSKNMCFVNSVLQLLVYTVPFQRLFFGIGKLRGTSVGLGKEGSASTTPLVDAMVEFVKEFVVTDTELYEGNARSGNVTNVNVWGKGKEKEPEREDCDEDELWAIGDEGEWWDCHGDEDELWGSESFLPSYVYEAMKRKKRFDNMQQEDPEEFLGLLLETLEEELVSLKETLTLTSSSSSSGWQEVGKKNRTIKGIESPISKIFGGKFRTTLKVPHKKKDSVIIEDWRSIQLDIQQDQIHTVKDALAYISRPQPLQVTDPAWPCTILEAHQVVHIEALPPVLVLHMNRFCYDTSVGGIVKVGKQVIFGPELEIGNHVLSHAIRKSQRPKYKLFGILYHHGPSAFGGFYTLDVLHPTRFSSSGGRPREGWIRIYDEMASDVRQEDVFGGERDDDRSAYLLFYRRIR